MGEMKMHKQKGFSLIELLIVVAIILIIAAIAVPSLLKAKASANESAAAATIRTINTSEATYNTTYPGNFGSLAQLGPGPNACPASNSAGACLIDSILGCSGGTTGAFCTKDNYKFTVTLATSADYIGFGTALTPTYGSKDFCSYGDLVVRYSLDNAAPGSATGTDALCASYTPI
jgi:type IV pilus assembly protein PilA